jgi:hypothetical protein
MIMKSVILVNTIQLIAELQGNTGTTPSSAIARGDLQGLESFGYRSPPLTVF